MIRVCIAEWRISPEWRNQLNASLWEGNKATQFKIDRTVDEDDTEGERRGGLLNLWNAIQRADDDDICVLMGGDDFLEPGGLELIAKAYEDPEVWLTYGSQRNTDGSPPHSARQEHDDVRHHPFVWMCLTCRAWLAKKILAEDLQIAGWWQWSSGDVALALPMIEMCGPIKGGHARFIEETWYVRRIHDGNDHKQSRRLQDFCCWVSRARPKYSALKDRHDTPTRTPHVLRDDLLFKRDSMDSYMLRQDPVPEASLPPVVREPDQWKCIPLGDHQLFCVGEPKDESKEKLRAMAHGMPDGIISLSNPSAVATEACKKDGIPFYTSADGFSTMGYVMPRQLSTQFLEWTKDIAPDCENPIALFAMATGRPLWHPVGDPPYVSTRPIPHVGRIHAFHWQLITKLKRSLPLRAYAVERDVA